MSETQKYGLWFKVSYELVQQITGITNTEHIPDLIRELKRVLQVPEGFRVIVQYEVETESFSISVATVAESPPTLWGMQMPPVNEGEPLAMTYLYTTGNGIQAEWVKREDAWRDPAIGV